MLERKSRKAFGTRLYKICVFKFHFGVWGGGLQTGSQWVRQWSLLILLVAVRVVNLVIRVVNTAVVSKYGGTRSKYSGS